MDLTEAIAEHLSDVAKAYQLNLNSEDHPLTLDRLVRKLYEHTGQRVVLLIDEYDKPLVDYLDRPEELEKNRIALRTLTNI